MPPDVLSTCVIGAMMEPLIRPLARAVTHPMPEIETLAGPVATVCVRMVRAKETGLTNVKATRRPR